MSLIKLIARPAYRVLRIPFLIAEVCKELVKRQRCTAAAGSKLHSSSRIFNIQGDRTKITIGTGSQVYGDLLVMRHGGCIEIGRNSFVSEGSRIWSARNIKIGDRVLISHDVNIHDTSSHSKSAYARQEHYRAGHPRSLVGVDEEAILIEDDVWIGFGSTILQGVTIGQGAIVGACSVVTRDVVAYTIVAGNPARPIGKSCP
jgi:acetyltransferase-like isoleucine patch superfamily enzyme